MECAFVKRFLRALVHTVTFALTHRARGEWWCKVREDWLFAIALFFIAFVAHAQYFPPPESSGGWRRLVSANSTPSSQQKASIRSTVGLDWDVLKQAWDASSQYGGTFLVIRNGWIAAEWGTTSTAIPVGSCTKTFTSLAMHRMFQMGANGSLAYPIAPDDLAYRYLPASWGSNATRRTIALRHLLDHVLRTRTRRLSALAERQYRCLPTEIACPTGKDRPRGRVELRESAGGYT